MRWWQSNVFLVGWCSWSEEAPVLVASLGKRWHGLAGWNCFPALYVISTSPLRPPPSAPFAVHPFYVCTRLIVQLHVHAHTCSHCSTMDSYAPPASPPAVTVIAHLLHSVRIKTTKPLFRCSSDIRVNLGKCTATLKSRFWGMSLIVF